MVFISYAREDRSCARALARELASGGIEAVIDPELVEGDPFWRETVAAELKKCELLVGLVSPASEASPWVEQEQRAFTGPVVSVDVDGFTRSAGPAGRGRLVAPAEPVAAIHRRVAGRGRCQASRIRGQSWWKTRERSDRMRDAELAMTLLLRDIAGMARPQLSAAHEVVFLDGGFMELRRVPDPDGKAGPTLLGSFPVTNAQYRVFQQSVGLTEPPTWARSEFRADGAPVTGITWFEALAFAEWCGGSLPTEEEWERAARGRSPARAYATSTGGIDGAVAYFARPFGACPPAATGTFPPTPEGFNDMCGNVWEWCATPWGPNRVIRGGGCMDAAEFCSIRARYRNAPIDRDCSVGFRVKIDTSRLPG
jgi:hypothetical protein